MLNFCSILRTFKGSSSDDGTLIKVVMDNSGIYAATSCTDKTLSIYDYQTGECMATMFGHSELVTGLKFTNDCKHLISVSGEFSYVEHCCSPTHVGRCLRFLPSPSSFRLRPDTAMFARRAPRLVL